MATVIYEVAIAFKHHYAAKIMEHDVRWCSRLVVFYSKWYGDGGTCNYRDLTMVLEPIHCPACDGIKVIKHGTTPDGKQRYFCQTSECDRRTFILSYTYLGHLPQVKQQIGDLAVNGSGIRDTARVLHISPTTVIEALKKKTIDPSSQ
jgi:transposase-like protein